VKRFRVRWQSTETFEAVVDVPDDQVDDLWDGDNSTLVWLEEPEAVDVTGEVAWKGLVREVHHVEEVTA
jgi:hypothetical protein